MARHQQHIVLWIIIVVFSILIVLVKTWMFSRQEMFDMNVLYSASDMTYLKSFPRLGGSDARANVTLPTSISSPSITPTATGSASSPAPQKRVELFFQSAGSKIITGAGYYNFDWFMANQMDNRVVYITVGPGTNVRLYQHPNRTGVSGQYGEGTHFLPGGLAADVSEADVW